MIGDSSEDVGEGDHGEEGHGDHHGVSGGGAANALEVINSLHGKRTTTVSFLGDVTQADLGLASAVFVKVIGDVVNALAKGCGSVLVRLAVELDVAYETSACA